jgi:hypothetical protein
MSSHFAKLTRAELFRVCEAMSKEIPPERVSTILSSIGSTNYQQQQQLKSSSSTNNLVLPSPDEISSSSSSSNHVLLQKSDSIIYDQSSSQLLDTNNNPITTSPTTTTTSTTTTTTNKRTRLSREFNMSKFSQRKIALWVTYFGENYHGFARNGDHFTSDNNNNNNNTSPTQQNPSDNTVETVLFSALTKTKLVDPNTNPREWEYSRCGRTDRGVSALGQVVALKVRSNKKPTIIDDLEQNSSSATTQDQQHQHQQQQQPEIDYVNILNRCLPNDVIILAWAPLRANP